MSVNDGVRERFARTTPARLVRKCGVRGSQVGGLAALGLVGVLFDTLGLTMLYPIGEYLLNNGDMTVLLETSRVWSGLHTAFGWVGYDPGIVTVVAMSAVFLLVRQIATYLRLIYQAALSHMMARRVRHRLFTGFLAARLNYQERLMSGPFANSMTTETTLASQTISGLLDFLIACAFTIGYVLLLFWLSPEAAAVVLGVLVAITIGMRGLLRKVRELSREIVKANAAFSQHFLERCRASRLIRLARSEPIEIHNASRLLNRQEKKNLSAVRAIAITESGIEPLALMLGVPALVAGVLVYGEDLSTVGMFLIVLARLAPMVKQVIRGWQAYLKIRASAENVLSTFNELDAAAEENAGLEAFPAPVREIRFEGVTFSYPNAETAALKGIDLIVPGGVMTAIVGPSGSGKSTLIDLIPRLRVPTGGQVRINDTPVNEIRIDALRAATAYVSQTPLLLSGSIAEHIAYGSEGLSRADVERAAHLANAHDFIVDLPNGYETVLGEGGVGLSGGQRQRVELARALACKAPILILDEPTSSVDGESAAQITQALRRIRAETETTILIVGHQLGALSDADKIVVLQSGTIAAEGDHRSLSAQPGWYRSTLAQQSGEGTQAAGVEPLDRSEAKVLP
ncbi:MAG: ABC transporter ATP-binding protein [Marivibrio sp.]|uniref:ABC transporter ATP-binding protein n=1 Tax=Marivibrio sp. TaxID=2039719 RepID=UPI0032EB6E72